MKSGILNFLLLWTIFVTQIICFSSSNTALGQVYPYRNYSVQDGLLNSNVFDICEDSIGFVWCATENGLSLFDGIRFTNFTLNDLGINSDVISVIPYKNNQIIFGTESNGAFLFGSDFARAVRINNSQVSRIDDLIVRDSVLVLLNEFKRIEFISINTGELIAIDSLAHNDGCDIPITIARLNSGRVLVGRTTGLYELVGFGFKKINTGIYDGRPVYSISETKEDEVLAGTDNIIYKIKPSGEIITLIEKREGEPRIRNIICDNRNNIWFNRWGTNELKNFQSNRFTDVTKLTGNINASITRLFQHSDGSLWFGTLGKGVYRFSGQLLLNYNVNSGLTNPNIRKLILTETGLLMGTSDGIGHLNFKTDGIIFNKHLNEISCYVRDIIQLNSGEYIVSVTDPRISKSFPQHRIENENIEIRYVQGSGLMVKDEVLMVSNWDNRFLKYHLPDYEFIEYVGPLLPEFNYNLRINALVYDSHDNMWVASKHGLRVINKLNEKASLKGDINNYEVFDFVNVGNDSLYIITSNGLYIVEANKNIQKCRVLSKITVPSTTCMIQMSEKKFLFGTTEGLIYFDKGIQHTITVHDGLLSNIIEDLLLVPEENIVFIASAEGLMKLDLESLRDLIETKPEINYLKIVYGNEVLVPEQNLIETDYNNSTLKLFFHSFNYTNPDNVIYQYRTEKTPWSDVSSNELQFASIDPGEHSIELRVGKAGGVWGASKLINVHLQPPFYRTWWFYGMVIVSAIILLVFFYKRQLAIYRNKQDEKTRIKQALIELQQKALASTLNPHFVFNSLNSIQHFINSSNTHDANIYLAKFSKLMRMHLDLADRSRITLDEEISRLEYYLNLEQMRFGSKLKWSINVSSDIDIYHTEIPNMIIQPFVENSVWHGIMPSTTPGNISINIELKSHRTIEIEITDNGVGFSEGHQNKQHESRGVNLIHDRLKLLDPDLKDVIVFSPKHPGTKVVLKLSKKMNKMKEVSEFDSEVSN